MGKGRFVHTYAPKTGSKPLIRTPTRISPQAAIKRFLTREAQGNLDYGSGFGGDAEDGEYFDTQFAEVRDERTKETCVCLCCLMVCGLMGV